jgi:hypothetical protein
MKTLHIVEDERYRTKEIFGNGYNYLYLLIDKENKKVLYSHVCSSPIYAYEDLWGGREERQEELKKIYGNDINIELNIL